MGILAGEAKWLFIKKLHSKNSLQSSAGLLILGSMVLQITCKILYRCFFFRREESLVFIRNTKEKKVMQKHAVFIIWSDPWPFIQHTFKYPTYNLCPTLCSVLRCNAVSEPLWNVSKSEVFWQLISSLCLCIYYYTLIK